MCRKFKDAAADKHKFEAKQQAFDSGGKQTAERKELLKLARTYAEMYILLYIYVVHVLSTQYNMHF